MAKKKLERAILAVRAVTYAIRQGVINNVPSCEARRERSAFSSRFRVRVTDRFNLPMVKRFPRYHEVKVPFRSRGGKCVASALSLSRLN